MGDDQSGVARSSAESLAAPRASGGRAILVLGVGLVLIALNMRGLTTSLSAVLPEITESTGLSPAGASWLTTIPSLCFGLFGPLAPFLARRLGIERGIFVALAALLVGTALRGFGTIVALFCGQILSGGAIGVLNILLPAILKRDFAARTGVMTGLYTMATSLGAAIAGGATVPLTSAFAGSWPAALGFWTAPVAVAAAIWLPQLRAKTFRPAQMPVTVSRLWKDPLARQVTFFMGLQGSFAYIVFGWFVPILRDRGIGADEAGFILSVTVVAQAVGALVTPMIAARTRDQRVCNSLATVFVVIGLFGCMYAPLSGAYLWAIILGISRGAAFSLAITVIVLRSPNAHVATYLSGIAQTVGYLIACLGPLVAGLLRGWTGDWNLAAVFFGLIGLLAIFFGIGAGRRLHVHAA